jgi:CRP/FNR family transcriptional regulator
MNGAFVRPEDVINSCKLFQELSEEHKALLVSICQPLQFAKRTLIFSEGDPVPGIYCVYDGVVRVFKVSASGKEHGLHFARAGMTFAEIAVLGGFECPAHAEALEDSVCGLLPTNKFRALLESNHSLCLELLSGLSFWVRELVGLLENVVLRDANSRVAAFLLATPEDSKGSLAIAPILKKDVANHLNLTSETFSRVLRQLSEQRLIDVVGSQRVRIIDRGGLEVLAFGDTLDSV